MLILDLKEESKDAKANNKQIRGLMKDLQLMGFSNDWDVAKNLLPGMNSAPEIASGKLNA